MPLPLILGITAAIAGTVGIVAGIGGAVEMSDANDKCKEAQDRQENNISEMETKQKTATSAMDKLGKKELDILNSFTEFQDLLERIQNRPDFKDIQRENVDIPEYNPDEIKDACVGAAVLVGGLGGAVAGTAGGFAAAGAAYAAVMALGTASTGTAIATLSGAAATNATLSALGGGAISAGGGGMALGSAILGGATLGVGLLVGGIIFGLTGSHLSDEADEAWNQMLENEKKINEIVKYLEDLRKTACKYCDALNKVKNVYHLYLEKLKDVLECKTDWYQFTTQEKMNTETLVMLVALLYNMCKVKLVLESSNKDEMNVVNHEDVNIKISKADDFLNEIAA